VHKRVGDKLYPEIERDYNRVDTHTETLDRMTGNGYSVTRILIG